MGDVYVFNAMLFSIQMSIKKFNWSHIKLCENYKYFTIITYKVPAIKYFSESSFEKFQIKNVEQKIIKQINRVDRKQFM